MGTQASAVFAHQTSHTTVTNLQTDLLQLFGHPWAALAAQAETRLFFDVRQRDQIRPLSATRRTISECTQSTHKCCQTNANPYESYVINEIMHTLSAPI